MVVSGFKEARTAFGVNFTVTGVSGTYRGVMRDTDYLLALGSGGFTNDCSGGLEYLSDEVTINIGNKVTIGSRTYRVDKFNDSDEDPVRVAFLVGVNK